MSSTASRDTYSRSIRRDEETTQYWVRLKRYHNNANLIDLDKTQAALAFFASKFNEEPLSNDHKLGLLIQLAPLVVEGLQLLDIIKARPLSSQRVSVTTYLDRVQTVLKSRF
ncbi:hypothetical protein FBU30_001970 [Linnemannia zychae]|nr:hypothetical protein FBU30_001970 [Linnemannia zychae]